MVMDAFIGVWQIYRGKIGEIVAQLVLVALMGSSGCGLSLIRLLIITPTRAGPWSILIITTKVTTYLYLLHKNFCLRTPVKRSWSLFSITFFFFSYFFVLMTNTNCCVQHWMMVCSIWREFGTVHVILTLIGPPIHVGWTVSHPSPAFIWNYGNSIIP